MNYCYWNTAASALACRQTKDVSEAQAAAMLHAEGGYLDPYSGEVFPFPSPEPSAEMLEQFPGLADTPRGANAKLKLLLHRRQTYQGILDKLHAAGKIDFYSPATHLKINNSNQAANPVVNIDEIASLILTYSADDHAPKVETGIVTNPSDDDKPWLIADSNDPDPDYSWYTPARYFARQLVKDDSTLLTKRKLLSTKVAQSLNTAGIKKRGGKQSPSATTILKAFANVTLG
jgi:hypothetical protein